MTDLLFGATKPPAEIMDTGMRFRGLKVYLEQPEKKHEIEYIKKRFDMAMSDVVEDRYPGLMRLPIL